MIALRNLAALLSRVALCAALAGCASFPLDPYLDQAVGQRVDAIRYLQLAYRKPMSDDGSTAVIEYSIDSLWRCRWIFDVEKGSGLVRAWRYPDAEAAHWCQTLPSSRP